VAGLRAWAVAWGDPAAPLKLSGPHRRATKTIFGRRIGGPCGWVTVRGGARQRPGNSCWFASMTRRCAPLCAAPGPRWLPPASRLRPGPLSDRCGRQPRFANTRPDRGPGRAGQPGRVCRPSLWPARSQLAQAQAQPNGWPGHPGARTRFVGRQGAASRQSLDQDRTASKLAEAVVDAPSSAGGGGPRRHWRWPPPPVSIPPSAWGAPSCRPWVTSRQRALSPGAGPQRVMWRAVPARRSSR